MSRTSSMVTGMNPPWHPSPTTRQDRCMRDLAEELGGPVLEVAPRLLGATLRHGEVAARITEVEAYDGPNDPGSHAANGPTPRNAVMFGPPGFLYVYFVYGLLSSARLFLFQSATADLVR